MSAVETVSAPPLQVPGAEARLPDVSVLVPVKERPAPLEQLYREYSAPLRASGTRFEFLFLIEPWALAMAQRLFELIEQGEPIRVLEVGQVVTESALLQVGALHARADILLTLPAYFRIDAYALPLLFAAVRDGADVVVARRWPRRDSAFSRLQNRIFHSLVSSVAGSRVNDVACGVRAMRREVLRELPLYGDFHRFLPLFAVREGYRTREVATPQHPADVRSGLFSPGIYLRRLVDLLGLFFLLRFTEKPLRFFGLLGSMVSAVGALLLIVLFAQRIAGQGIADRPLLLLGVLLLVVGFQAIALGLIGEIVVHFSAPAHRPYRLMREVDPNHPSPLAATPAPPVSRPPHPTP